MNDYSWKKIDNTREMMEFESFLLIRNLGKKAKNPICCKVCQTMLRGADDIEEHAKLGACKKCCDKWAYVNYKEWNNGWRPSEEDIIKELKDRKSKPVFQISLEHDN
jgi:hypothetical protein